jgi:hypothetical protein
VEVLKAVVNWCFDNSVFIGLGVLGVVGLIAGLKYAASGDNPMAKRSAMTVGVAGVVGFFAIAFMPKIVKAIYDLVVSNGGGGSFPWPQ